MDFHILTNRTRHHRKNHQSKSQNCHSIRISARFKIHIFEEKKHYRNQDEKLRKSRNNKRPSQSFHLSEDLKRKLLNPSKHIARRITHRKWQSSHNKRIIRICRDQIGNNDCQGIDNENKKSPHSNELSIRCSQLRISIRFWNIFSFTISCIFDLPKLFDCNYIDSEIHKSCPPGKKSENRSIVPISQRTKIRSNNFSNHKTK